MDGEFKPPKLETDLLQRFLMSANLLQHERSVRIILNTLGAPAKPGKRELTIATLVVLMRIGQVDQDVVSFVQAELAKLPAETLRDSAVAIVNGDHLLLPGKDGGIRTIPMFTESGVQSGLTDSSDGPPVGWVSTIYSLASVWERAEKLGV